MNRTDLEAAVRSFGNARIDYSIARAKAASGLGIFTDTALETILDDLQDIAALEDRLNARNRELVAS